MRSGSIAVRDHSMVNGTHDDTRFNFIANALDGALFTFAMSFVSMVTVFPVLVKKAGGSNIAVGLIPVFWTFGFNFPQILAVNRVRKAGRKKRIVLKTAIGQRLPWLFLAAILFWLIEDIGKTPGLILILGGFFLAAVGGSLNMPGWFDLVSKLTPVYLRGRLFALRSVLGALLGILGGWLVAQILDHIRYPDSFALLFLIAFTLMMVSYVFLLVLRENTVDDPRQPADIRDMFRELTSILRNDRNFRNFVIADAMFITALMADAFYTVNAMDRFGLSEGYAGRFTMVMMISMIGGNLLFGYMADRKGHRINLIVATVSIVMICLLAVFAPVLGVYYLVFVGAAFTISLIHVSRLTIVAELAREQNRSVYVALINMLTAPFVLSGVIGGWLADHYGYDIVFILAAVFAALSCLWLVVFVREPRGQVIGD